MNVPCEIINDAPLGAVSVPLIIISLNALVALPDMVVVPPNVVVPEPRLSMPLLATLPSISRLAEGVNVPVPEIVMAPNTGVVLPVRVVLPEKVMGLAVSVELELLTKFPFMLIARVPASNTPPLVVRIPFIVIGLFRLTVPLLLMVKLFNAVAEEGNSNPVVPTPV